MKKTEVTLEELQMAYELAKFRTTDTYTAKEYAGLMANCGLSSDYKARPDATKIQKEAASLYRQAYLTRLDEIRDENNRKRSVTR